MTLSRFAPINLVKERVEHMFGPTLLALGLSDIFNPVAKLMSYPLELFYDITRDYGLTIVLLTCVVRLIMFPLTYKQTTSMLAMQQLQPELQAIKTEHSHDRMKLNEEMQKLYKERGVNPVAGCLPVVVQMPFFFGMFRLISGLSRVQAVQGLLVAVANPKFLSPSSAIYRDLVNAGGAMHWLGIDLSQSFSAYDGDLVKRLPYLTLVILQAVTGLLLQFLMERSQPIPTGQAAQMRTMMRGLPVVFAVFSVGFPAAVVLYWVMGNVWMMGQQEVLTKLRRRHAAKIGLELPSPRVAVASAVVAGSAEKTSLTKKTRNGLQQDKKSLLGSGKTEELVGTAKTAGSKGPSSTVAGPKPTVRPPARSAARPSGNRRSGSKKGR